MKRITDITLSAIAFVFALVAQSLITGATDNVVAVALGWFLVAIMAANFVPQLFDLNPTYQELFDFGRVLLIGAGTLGLVVLADHTGNSVLVSLSWTVVAVAVGYLGILLADIVGELLQIRRTLVQLLLSTAGVAFVVGIAFTNPAGTVLSQITLGCAAVGAAVYWYASITHRSFRSMMDNRRSTRPGGLHRLIPV